MPRFKPIHTLFGLYCASVLMVAGANSKTVDYPVSAGGEFKVELSPEQDQAVINLKGWFCMQNQRFLKSDPSSSTASLITTYSIVRSVLPQLTPEDKGAIRDFAQRIPAGFVQIPRADVANLAAYRRAWKNHAQQVVQRGKGKLGDFWRFDQANLIRQVSIDMPNQNATKKYALNQCYSPDTLRQLVSLQVRHAQQLLQTLK